MIVGAWFKPVFLSPPPPAAPPTETIQVTSPFSPIPLSLSQSPEADLDVSPDNTDPGQAQAQEFSPVEIPSPEVTKAELEKKLFSSNEDGVPNGNNMLRYLRYLVLNLPNSTTLNKLFKMEFKFHPNFKKNRKVRAFYFKLDIKPISLYLDIIQTPFCESKATKVRKRRNCCVFEF